MISREFLGLIKKSTFLKTKNLFLFRVDLKSLVYESLRTILVTVHSSPSDQSEPSDQSQSGASQSGGSQRHSGGSGSFGG